MLGEIARCITQLFLVVQNNVPALQLYEKLL
ncbi:protein of unknown function [Paenibacillus alvei]|uniref:Uncharacterized protein n=1 Tax=Paenibacillus alvei TaxID=44250 RepID=A0A383R9P1_PAEAL|nr:protein of unknown function [Paenibacillus alvei]